jgi:hypothetical protein
VAHRGVLWAAFAEGPALTTPPGTLSTKFDRPGYNHQIWNLGTAHTHLTHRCRRKRAGAAIWPRQVNCCDVVNQLKHEGLDEHEFSTSLTIPLPLPSVCAHPLCTPRACARVEACYVLTAEAAAVAQRKRGRLSRRPSQKQGGSAGGRHEKRAAVAGGRHRNNALGQGAPTTYSRNVRKAVLEG